LLRNFANLLNTDLWLMILSAYLATDLPMPKNRTITTATLKVSTGGINEAIVINQPLVTFKPTPAMYESAESKYAKIIARSSLPHRR
jgi:hypothetical protein